MNLCVGIIYQELAELETLKGNEPHCRILGDKYRLLHIGCQFRMTHSCKLTVKNWLSKIGCRTNVTKIDNGDEIIKNWHYNLD